MNCPQCHSDVPVTEAQYLSMYTCPKCMAVYFIDMNGQPEFGDMSATIPDPYQSNDQSLSPAESASNPETASFSQPSMEVSEQPVLSEFDLMSQQGESADAGVVADVGAATADSEMNSGFDLSTLSQSSENPFSMPTAMQMPHSSLSSVVNEITDFANQNESVAGAVTYDLLVSGLDSKEIMMLFREALEDSKLGWLPQDVVGFIKGGQCELKNLTAVQAFVVARRIQFLDIEMKWTQNV